MTGRSRCLFIPLLCLAVSAPVSNGKAGGNSGDAPAETFLFSVPLSGTYMKKEEEVRISYVQGPYVAPRLSSDGKKILLNSKQGGKIGVWVAEGEGWKMARICDGDQAGWSADGGRIIFRRAGAIMERELETGQERTVSPKGWSSCRFPGYLADGRIALVSYGDGDELVVLDPAGSSAEVVARGEINSAPRCSPDGTRIAYQDGAHIRLVDLRDRKTAQLTTAGGVQSWPVWSRDGASICYCQSPEFAGGPWDIHHIEIANPHAAGLVRRKVDAGFDWSGRSPEVDSRKEIRGRSIVLRRGKGNASPEGEFTVENDWLVVRLSTGDGGVSVIAKGEGSSGERMELAVLDGGGGAAAVDAVRIVENDGENVVLDAGFRSRDDTRMEARIRIPRTRPVIEMKPSRNAGGVYVKRSMRLALLPDRLADDLIFDPGRCPAESAVPATPVLLGCLPGLGGMVVLVAPGTGQKMTMIKDGRKDRFAGVKVAARGESVFISVLAGGNMWRQARIEPRPGKRGWEAAWSSPFYAQWRLATAGKKGNYSCTWGEQALSDMKKPRLEIERGFSEAPASAVIYLQGRSWHTPLDVLTPMDVCQDILGPGGCRDVLDVDGTRTYRTSREWVPFLEISTEDKDWDIYGLHTAKERGLGVLEAFGGIRQGETEGIEAITAHLGDDILNLLQGLDGRMKEYRDFFAGLEEFLRVSGKGSETEFPGSVLPGIATALNKCAGMPLSGIEKVSVALDDVRKSLSAPGNHEILLHSDEFKRLHGVATSALAERQKVLEEYRGLAKSLREEAGDLATRAPAGLADLADEIRARTGMILRNRYYLEGDWRGEEPLQAEETAGRR